MNFSTVLKRVLIIVLASVALTACATQKKASKDNLLQGDVLEFLKKECTTQYDLIFIDPPYDGKLLQESLNLLQVYRYFIGCSYLFFEQINDKQNKTNLDFMNRDWIILKDLSIGEVSYTIAKKRE